MSGQGTGVATLSVLPKAMEHNRGSRCTPAIIGESPLTTWKRWGRLIIATKYGKPVSSMRLLLGKQNTPIFFHGPTYIKAGPTGLVSAMVNGKMARSRWKFPKESQDIQAKNPIQHTPEIVKVEIMVALFHENAVLPASWSAKTSSVEAASSRTAPSQSTCWSNCQDILGVLYVFSFRGQQTSMVPIPTAAAGALNK